MNIGEVLLLPCSPVALEETLLRIPLILVADYCASSTPTLPILPTSFLSKMSGNLFSSISLVL